jgi:hypothetical protein
MENMTNVKFEIIVAMLSEDTKLLDMLIDFVKAYEEIKDWHFNKLTLSVNECVSDPSFSRCFNIIVKAVCVFDFVCFHNRVVGEAA